MRRVKLATILLGLMAVPVQAATILVEAESFANCGGWALDTQLMDTMGSPYLLAHGLGTPVRDATTTVRLPVPGEYRVYVRTKDWVARWRAPGTPGRFQLLVDGKPLPEAFGTKGADWFWHDGGTVKIDRREVALALHDLTGFEGRCDAILLTNDVGFSPPNDRQTLAAFRRTALGLPDMPIKSERFDIVVVGGGIAGCCTAITSARLGLTVALIQDRGVLGGNNSSEVRVGVSGGTKLGAYPVLGEVVEEIRPLGYWVFRRAERNPSAPENAAILETFAKHPEKNIHNAGPTSNYEDEKKMAAVRAEPNVRLSMNLHVFRVEKAGNRIVAVIAKHTASGAERRYCAPLFVDCTGDGTLGYLAGADYEMTKKGTMGASNMWRIADEQKPCPFPRCPWALDLTKKPFPTKSMYLGDWRWETGFNQDMIEDLEAIRDHNFRAMYGAWDCLKNVQKRYQDYRLEWAAYIAGKRESRRLLGDVILSKEDMLERKQYPDGCVATDWGHDLHYPDERYAKGFEGVEFISRSVADPLDLPEARRRQSSSFLGGGPYLVPYRCLYSRNIGNLMMAGRDVSVTHEALGTVRVKATTGMMGEALGRAAYLCRKHQTDPRGIYEKHLDEFKRLLAQSTITTGSSQPATHTKGSAIR